MQVTKAKLSIVPGPEFLECLIFTILPFIIKKKPAPLWCMSLYEHAHAVCFLLMNTQVENGILKNETELSVLGGTKEERGDRVGTGWRGRREEASSKRHLQASIFSESVTSSFRGSKRQIAGLFDKRKFPFAVSKLLLVFVFFLVRQGCLKHTSTKLGSKQADVSKPVTTWSGRPGMRRQ